MDKKTKALTIAASTALASTLAMAAPTVNAAQNPFAISDLGAGYQQVADKAAEGQCGANKTTKPKAQEASCGANKKTAEEEQKKKAKEGSCGAKK